MGRLKPVNSGPAGGGACQHDPQHPGRLTRRREEYQIPLFTAVDVGYEGDAFEPVVVITAESPHHAPTTCVAAHPEHEPLAEYAREMARADVSALGIASRMGLGGTLYEGDHRAVPSPALEEDPDKVRRRVFREPEWVTARVAEATGRSREEVDEHLAAFREAVDHTLAADGSVVVPPLALSYAGDPVAALVAEKYRTATDEELYALDTGDVESIAAWLGITEDEYLAHPVAGAYTLMAAAVDVLHGDDRQLPESELHRILDLMEAWAGTYAEGRPYRVSTVGLELALERWLVAHIDRLTDAGFPVEILHQQLVLPDRRRPDLVVRFTADTEWESAGDLMVIELKAGRCYTEAIDQLHGYLPAVAAKLMPGSNTRVHGMLIADGASHRHQEDLRSRGLRYLPVERLGYRRELRAEPATRRVGS